MTAAAKTPSQTPPSPYWKTPEVCRMVDRPYYTVIGLMRHGVISTPRKDSSGDFAWGESDIAALRAALATRPRRVRRKRAVAV